MSHRRSLLRGLGGGGACAAFGLHAYASGNSRASPIRVAAASDLKFALAELGLRFEQETGLKLAITFGSSGHLARQLEQGLPMDLFLSADEALVHRLAKTGWARDTGWVYGKGRLVWMLPKASSGSLDAHLTGLMGILGANGKLSIANPEHAPYGRAAQSALLALGQWAALRNRLVLGESVTQATQFVSTGAAQVGIVALSLALAPEVASRTQHGLVSEALYPPIIQRMALHHSASASAQRFYTFLQTDGAKKVLARHGLD